MGSGPVSGKWGLTPFLCRTPPVPYAPCPGAASACRSPENFPVLADPNRDNKKGRSGHQRFHAAAHPGAGLHVHRCCRRAVACSSAHPVASSTKRRSTRNSRHAPRSTWSTRLRASRSMAVTTSNPRLFRRRGQRAHRWRAPRREEPDARRRAAARAGERKSCASRSCAAPTSRAMRPAPRCWRTSFARAPRAAAPGWPASR